MPKICRYNKGTDRKIVLAVEDALKTKVIGCVKMQNGAVNHVFKISTERGDVIARIFKFENWPEDGKLEWIEKNLAARKIPHARLLYFTRNKKYFPHGFMVQEFVPGIDGWDAIRSGFCTIGESYFEKGKILKKIHQIKIKKFGPIKGGKGKSLNFITYKLNRANRLLKRLIKDKAIGDITEKFNNRVWEMLEPFSKSFKPVLIHGDATRKNTIWAKGNGLILIDWDNAWSGIWFWDFIELSWWWRHLKIWRDKKKREIARREFFKGYGKTGYTAKQIQTLEHGLHLIKSVERLHFFYYDNKNKQFFKLVKKFFLGDLNNNNL